MEELKKDYYFEDISAFPFAEIIEDIDLIQDYFKKKEAVLKNIKRDIRSDIPENVTIKGEVFIDEGVVIDPYVVITGPVYIGKNVLIRNGAWIRPGNIIGNDVVIGHGVELKNSHLAAEVKLGTNVFVGDSILGKGARIGSGVITGNRRFDQKDAIIHIKDKQIETGKDKFGVIVGEYARIGANALTSPGTIIGKHTWIYGGASVSGFIPKESLVKLRQTLEIAPKDGNMILSKEDKAGHR